MLVQELLYKKSYTGIILQEFLRIFCKEQPLPSHSRSNHYQTTSGAAITRSFQEQQLSGQSRGNHYQATSGEAINPEVLLVFSLFFLFFLEENRNKDKSARDLEPSLHSCPHQSFVPLESTNICLLFLQGFTRFSNLFIIAFCIPRNSKRTNTQMIRSWYRFPRPRIPRRSCTIIRVQEFLCRTSCVVLCRIFLLMFSTVLY